MSFLTLLSKRSGKELTNKQIELHHIVQFKSHLNLLPHCFSQTHKQAHTHTHSNMYTHACISKTAFQYNDSVISLELSIALHVRTERPQNMFI